ncbi:MAG: 16S rRNA (cytidine(1402)-2'-O)-methyltransferase [Lentisphaeria bacterium]|nr:16S rRNA (cytidine(1402)-2'-O)-methyltransferase [Lentisphaeria bacterium]
MEPSAGQLILVATPIGNLDDITLRALHVLKTADIIAAEDTRRARILCSKFDIHTKLVAHHAHNEHRTADRILDQVENGKTVVVLSDAGTPAIADPGFFIVRAAYDRGIVPTVIPGVSALTFAVVACGLPVDRFAFLGFPPVKSGRRETFLTEAADLKMTVFIYEAPHRITKLLTGIHEVMGPQTPVALIREATKLHEECLRGTVGELLAEHADRQWRGECVVAVNTREAMSRSPAGNGDRQTRTSKYSAKSRAASVPAPREP